MSNHEKITKYLNQVFLKDIMELLKELPDKSVDMVYGDPDYNVGIKYGDKSYTKTFDEYIGWYIELARESLRVLKDTGNMFLMNYPKQNAYLRVKYLDEACYDISDYIWVYNTNVGHSPNRFTTAHRSILHCRKTKDNKFYKENVAVPYKNPTDKRILNNLANGSKGRMPYDWFYFDLVKNVSKEKTFHACQIPQKLSEMLIESCTMPDDIVLVLFGGSGSEIEICKTLRRQYISAEIDEKYHRMAIDRLKNGYIEKKYKLKLSRFEINNIEKQPTLFEKRAKYLTNKSHSVNNNLAKSIDRAIKLMGTPVDYEKYASIKIEPVQGGCCCFHCWPKTWNSINKYISPFGNIEDDGDVLIGKNNGKFVLECHESGPEIVVYLGLGTASVVLIKSVIDLITALLKTLQNEGNKQPGKLRITRRCQIKGQVKEEIIIEIELPLSTSVIKRINNNIKNAFK